jgi:hypothetical protein
MRYIIYSFCYETPHFETDLEIAKKLTNEGHEVYFLTCKGELKTCFINSEHQKSICDVCKSKINNGLKILNVNENKILSFSNTNNFKLSFDDALVSFEGLKNYEYKGCDIGLGVVSSLVSTLRDHNFDVKLHSEKIKIALETSIFVYENFKQIIAHYQPDGIIVFNGRFLETKPVLHLCIQNNIKFFTHERGGQLDRYMYRENSTPHSLTFAKQEIEFLWNNNDENKFLIGNKFFEERRNKIIQNWFVYTNDQKIGFLPISFDEKKRNIAIFNSSIDEYVTIPDFENKIYLDDNEGIAKICESFENDKNFHFYLRLHPNLAGLDNTQTRKINEFKSKFSNLTVIEASEQVDSYALMEIAETVITFGSTIGIEAVYWKTKSILIGRAYYENINGVLNPNTHEEVCEMIRQDNKNVIQNSDAIKFGYWSLMYGNKFEFFKPKSLFKGTFLNKKVKANLFALIKLKLNNIKFKLNN